MPRKLTRETHGAMLAGVAAGFARYLDIDPVLARLGFVLLAFVNGLGILVYLAGWALMPLGSEGAPTEGYQTLHAAGDQLAAEVRKVAGDAASAQLAIGTVLVVTGTLLLAHNLGWLEWPYWMRFKTLWPLLLVALGAGLVLKSKRAASA